MTLPSKSPAFSVARPVREDAFDAGYPSGMVWCPMKMSGMAILKCAELQRRLGCGTLRQLKSLKTGKTENQETEDFLNFPNLRIARFTFWPWLRRRGECRWRATEEEIRELRQVLTPLKLIEHARSNPQAYRCPRCGGPKVFEALRCRSCWRATPKNGHARQNSESALHVVRKKPAKTVPKSVGRQVED